LDSNLRSERGGNFNERVMVSRAEFSPGAAIPRTMERAQIDQLHAAAVQGATQSTPVEASGNVRRGCPV